MGSLLVLIVEPFPYHRRVAKQLCMAFSRAGAEVHAITTASIVRAEQSAADGWEGAASISTCWPEEPNRGAATPSRWDVRLLRRVMLAARALGYSFHAWSAVRRAAKGRVPDAVVFTTCTVAVQLASVCAFRRQRCLIGVVHEGPSPSRLARRVLAAFTGRTGYAIGCMSAQFAESYVGAGADPRGVEVVPNPVAPLHSRPEASAVTDAVGYFGNAREEKGFDFLVAALPALLDVGRVLVQCYATGDPTPKIHEAIQSLRRIDSPRLRVLEGFTNESQHSESIAGVAAVLLPYVPKDYGIGRVSALLTEAWAAGTPVIVSDGWWGAEQVMRYGGGLVFEFGNVPSFVRCVREVLSDRERFSRLAADAFRRLSRDDGPAAFARWVLNRCTSVSAIPSA